jgi:hypothetical protein
MSGLRGGRVHGFPCQASGSSWKVGLLDRLGGGNLGNDATLAAVMLNTLKAKAKGGLREYGLINQVLWVMNATVICAPRALFKELRFLVKSYRSYGQWTS